MPYFPLKTRGTTGQKMAGDCSSCCTETLIRPVSKFRPLSFNSSNMILSPKPVPTNPWWVSNYRLMAALALLPAFTYIYISWLTTSNTPYGDGYIQSLFTVIHWKDGNSLGEQLSNTWWTYFQNRAVFSKFITLLLYAIQGSIDLRVEGLFSNTTLVILIALIAISCHQYKLPAYNILLAALMILSVYSWTITTWPECALFYFSTLTFSFLTFLLLDLTQARVLAAVICSWLATFTMANGLLAIIIGSLLVLHNHGYRNRYTRLQLAIWIIGAIGGFLLHLTTMNVFSTELFGAKSLQDSFINVSGRMVDFVESIGAAPFFPNEYRKGKIVLGAIILVTTTALLMSPKSWRNPAIIGLLLFNTGTIFLTSLFRYSAGGNDGYQIFTATNYAALFAIASSHIDRKDWRIPVLLIIMAVTFNANALIKNLPKMLEKKQQASTELQQLLLNSDIRANSWESVLLRDAISADIYRPLQNHDSLPIAQTLQSIANCPPPKNSAGKLQINTNERVVALNADIQLPEIPESTSMQLFLCGTNQNYKITLNKTNINPQSKNTLTVLLDKRKILPDTYSVIADTGNQQLVLPEPLTIATTNPWMPNPQDCKSVRFFAQWKAFSPFVEHYCTF
ncbi:MAG: hypothetical protein R3E67_02680 [Pseudomonadales bacterium]